MHNEYTPVESCPFEPPFSSAVALYGLYDPQTQALRYIGVSKNPRERLAAHTQPHFLQAETYKNHWLRSLLAQGMKPVMRIHRWVREDEWQVVEQDAIAEARGLGHPITNHCAGGRGRKGDARTPEWRAQVAAKMHIWWEQGDRKAQKSLQAKGLVHTEAAKQKIGNANRGRPVTDAVREERRRRQKAYRASEETKQKQRIAMLGKPRPAASIAKMQRSKAVWKAFGERKTKREWLQDPRCNVGAHCLRRRLAAGISLEEAMTHPPQPGRGPRPHWAEARVKLKVRCAIWTAFGETKSKEDWLHDPRTAVKSRKLLNHRLASGMDFETALTKPTQRSWRHDERAEVLPGQRGARRGANPIRELRGQGHR